MLLTLLILTLVWLGKCGIEKAAVSTEGIDVYLEERKTEMTQKNLNQLCWWCSKDLEAAIEEKDEYELLIERRRSSSLRLWNQGEKNKTSQLVLNSTIIEGGYPNAWGHAAKARSSVSSNSINTGRRVNFRTSGKLMLSLMLHLKKKKKKIKNNLWLEKPPKINLSLFLHLENKIIKSNQ